MRMKVLDGNFSIKLRQNEDLEDLSDMEKGPEQKSHLRVEQKPSVLNCSVKQNQKTATKIPKDVTRKSRKSARTPRVKKTQLPDEQIQIGKTPPNKSIQKIEDGEKTVPSGRKHSAPKVKMTGFAKSKKYSEIESGLLEKANRLLAEQNRFKI